MLSSGCSPFGIGTDIGGSCRIPCEWTGLCTLKHGHRFTRIGNAFSGKYKEGMPIKSEIAPMAKTVEDLILFCQFIFDQEHYYPSIDSRKHDIYIRQIPFDETIFTQMPKLTVGYHYNIN